MDPNGLVAAAVEGFAGYVATQPAPEPGGDYLPLDHCPILSIDELNGVFRTVPGQGATFPDVSASIGAETTKAAMSNGSRM